MERPTFNKDTGRHELNGVDFDGHFDAWGLEYVPKTYLKESELSGDQWRKGGAVKIYLNGDCVLNEFCRTPERAMLLLAKGLHELQCFFELGGIDFIYNWKEKIIGRKVHHGGFPSTITAYCGDGEVIVKRDDGKPFLPDLYPSLAADKEFQEEDDWNDEDRVHITDKRLSWHI